VSQPVVRSRLVTLAAALLATLAAAGPAGARPYGFLATPTDQLAVPGYVAGFEVTPEGFLYNGRGELVFRAGPRLVGLRAPVRTLEGGRARRAGARPAPPTRARR